MTAEDVIHIVEKWKEAVVGLDRMVYEDAKKEFAQVVMMKSTDKLCLFTNKGNMHQIKCDKIPRCQDA